MFVFCHVFVLSLFIHCNIIKVQYGIKVYVFLTSDMYVNINFLCSCEPYTNVIRQNKVSETYS